MRTFTISEVFLDELKDYFENRQDVCDGSYGEQVANEEMSLLMRLEEECRPIEPPVKKLGFAASVREYGDDWIQHGFAWNGTSYRGMSAATIIALQDSRGPDDEDFYQMKRCAKHGRMFQVSGS